MDELRPLRLFRDQIPEHDEAARAIARARLADEQRHWEGRASAIARTGRTWQLPFGQRLSRRVLVFVVLLMQIALLASPAVGVVGYVRDLFEGTPPTPLVQQRFNQWDEAMATLPNHPPHRPGNWDVDTSKVHGVIAVQTPDGPLYLWAAPIREGGGQCWLLQFANDSNPEDTLYGPSGRDGP